MNIKDNRLKERKVNFSNCILNKNKVWFVSTEGYFMNIDVDTKKTSYIKLKNLNSWKKHPVTDNMFAYRGNIYWVDQFGKYIHEYDIDQNEYYEYQLPPVEMIEWQCYAGIYLYNEKLFLFPRIGLTRIEFDLHEKKYVVYPWNCSDEDFKVNKKEDIQLWCSVQSNNWLYLFERNRNKAIRMNFENLSYEYIDIPHELSNIQHIVFKNNVFYILSVTGNLYIWDGCSKQVEEVYDCNDKELSFARIAITEHKVFLLPDLSEKIWIIDLENHEIKVQDQYPADLEYNESGWSKYFGYTEDKQYMWFANRTANYVLRINKYTEIIEWIKVVPPKIEDEWKVHLETGRMIFTEEQNYLRLFISLESSKTEKGKNKESLGECIWNTIKMIEK